MRFGVILHTIMEQFCIDAKTSKLYVYVWGSCFTKASQKNIIPQEIFDQKLNDSTHNNFKNQR